MRARYAYEPYGARTRIAGDLDADFGFTGHFYHERTGLCLSLYRAYDPRLGRWLSRDPLPEAERLLGPNLYAYVNSDPVNATDPLGLHWYDLNDWDDLDSTIFLSGQAERDTISGFVLAEIVIAAVASPAVVGVIVFGGIEIESDKDLPKLGLLAFSSGGR